MSIRSAIVNWFLKDQKTRDWLSLHLGTDHIMSVVNGNAETARNEREWHRRRIYALETKFAELRDASTVSGARSAPSRPGEETIRPPTLNADGLSIAPGVVMNLELMSDGMIRARI